MNKKLYRIRLILGLLLLIVAVTGFYSCEKNSFTPPKINTVDTVHFAIDIQPIFNAHCITCHGGVRSPDLRSGNSYHALTTGLYVTLPGETSRLYLKMTSADHTARSNDLEKQKVLIWINQGALNN